MDVQNGARTPNGANQRSPQAAGARRCAVRRAGRGSPRRVAGGRAAARTLLRRVPRARPRAARGPLPGDRARAAGALLPQRGAPAPRAARGGSSTGRCTCTATSAAAERSSPARARAAARRRGPREQRTPEIAALLEDDRLIVTEFLAELSELERHVFWLMAEGMRYRAIAPVLAVSVNEARKAAAGCEAKRERFQLLYDTGRLCGFRAADDRRDAGRTGRRRGARPARLRAPRGAARHCRAQHKTNAGRLRRSFQGQAAALAPVPLLAGRLHWLAKLEMRARGQCTNASLPYGAPPAGGGVREGTVAMLAGGGVAAKLAAGGATVAVIAGGAIGATHALATHQTSNAHAEPARAGRGPLQQRRHPPPIALRSNRRAESAAGEQGGQAHNRPADSSQVQPRA